MNDLRATVTYDAPPIVAYMHNWRDPFYRRCELEGFQAWHELTSRIGSNPYPDKTIAALFWAAGWKRAAEENA